VATNSPRAADRSPYELIEALIFIVIDTTFVSIKSHRCLSREAILCLVGNQFQQALNVNTAPNDPSLRQTVQEAIERNVAKECHGMFHIEAMGGNSPGSAVCWFHWLKVTGPSSWLD
jgi:hypothetical protein